MNTNEIASVLTTLRAIGNDTVTCEVKRAQGGLPATVWETLSAFANANGGHLLLGIDEKKAFAVTGVDDLARWKPTWPRSVPRWNLRSGRRSNPSSSTGRWWSSARYRNFHGTNVRVINDRSDPGRVPGSA
ncbi:helix-turn-helix domain-containing protein [Actinoplanes sp. NPDC051494]|uniref:helix-turn-helix domain-containing protein n=1 Tax=Actinoplanes sp. NPDC051494 TaxID=3363907 RepID=UPI0037A418F4